ncbi:MAG TPA: zinc ribbon domain-containing protein [Terracidiphilus sp.]
MYCSGCGQAVAQGQTFCPSCGRPVAPIAPVAPPPVPGFAVQLDSYATKVRALGILWFVYAGLSLLAGFAGLAFLRAVFFGGIGPWMHGMHGGPPPPWMFPALVPFLGLLLALRAALAVAAGWGLLQHAQWGRIVAIIAAIISLIKFPFGTALGIFTLVVLLGYQNSRLYEHL